MKKSIPTRLATKNSQQSKNSFRATALAYYNYLAYSSQPVSDRGIEDSLLAAAGAPKISDYGLEENPLLDGWWYTGVDEEGFDRLIDNFNNNFHRPRGA